MDNAKIHHGIDVLELCEHFGEPHHQMVLVCCWLWLGVRIEYLPPYSPDFQPIEEAFSKVKAFLRRHRDYYKQTIGDGILFDMYEVMEIITPEDAVSYFMHAGYFWRITCVCTIFVTTIGITNYSRPEHKSTSSSVKKTITMFDYSPQDTKNWKLTRWKRPTSKSVL